MYPFSSLSMSQTCKWSKMNHLNPGPFVCNAIWPREKWNICLGKRVLLLVFWPPLPTWDRVKMMLEVEIAPSFQLKKFNIQLCTIKIRAKMFRNLSFSFLMFYLLMRSTIAVGCNASLQRPTHYWHKWAYSKRINSMPCPHKRQKNVRKCYAIFFPIELESAWLVNHMHER